MSSMEEGSDSPPKQKLSCTKYFDALWFCYSPVHQLQQYYRLGVLDNCHEKWSSLADCLMLKTKHASYVQNQECAIASGQRRCIYGTGSAGQALRE